MVYARRRLWLLALAIWPIGWTPSANADDAKPALGVISGKIVLSDGSPSKSKGWLQTARKPLDDPNRKYPDSHYHGEFQDKFSFQIQPGTVWIKYFAKGYAPIWAGPLEVAPGQQLGNVQLTLLPGNKALLRVLTADKKPVPGAKILAMPVIVNEASGNVQSVRANELGELRLEHVAATPYYLRVTAPAFEPLIVDELPLSFEDANTLMLSPSLPATGTVCDVDGKPVQGAKIRFRVQQAADRRARVDELAFAAVMATTDAAGHFSIDQLIRDWQYLFVVEGADGSRIAVRTIRAGTEGVQVRLPKDQTLRLKIVGDISGLPKRKGQPYVQIDQLILAPWGSQHSIDGTARAVDVVPAEGGGVVHYPGLTSGEVQITVGGTLHKFTVVENGLTEVTIELDKDKAN